MVLSAAEITGLQATQRAYMPDLCDVIRPTNTENAAGEQHAVPTTVYHNLPCQVSPRVLRQLAEKIEGQRIESAVRWIIVVPWGTVVTNDDTIVVTEHVTGHVNTYLVNGVQADESWESAIQIEALLVA